MKNMMHGERDKYHRDSSAMCHLLQSWEREECNIRFSKQQNGMKSLLLREQQADGTGVNIGGATGARAAGQSLVELNSLNLS